MKNVDRGNERCGAVSHARVARCRHRTARRGAGWEDQKNSMNGLTHCKVVANNSETFSGFMQMVACMLMKYILNSSACELCGQKFSHEQISRHF